MLGLLGAHVIAMMIFEHLGFWQSVWLTLVTVSTVGYGDVSANTVQGQVSTIIVIMLGAVMVLPKLAADYLEFRSIRRDKKLKGNWRWNMKDHIVILNTPVNDPDQYLNRLISQFNASHPDEEPNVQIVTSAYANGLPNTLLSLKNVTHFNGRADDLEALEQANVKEARAIIILSKRESDKHSDGRTFDILHRLKDLGVDCRILAECVNDDNRNRLGDAGANVVIRPIRAYPEMIVRAFVAPGSEQIIENMFSNSEDEYLRFDIDVSRPRWADVTCAFAVNDIGTAIGYIDKDTAVLHCNPPQLEPVNASAVFLVAREESKPTVDAVIAALQ